jgi:hypothetical protein
LPLPRSLSEREEGQAFYLYLSFVLTYQHYIFNEHFIRYYLLLLPPF